MTWEESKRIQGRVFIHQELYQNLEMGTGFIKTTAKRVQFQKTSLQYWENNLFLITIFAKSGHLRRS